MLNPFDDIYFMMNALLEAEIALVGNIFKYKRHDEKKSPSGTSDSTGGSADKGKETNTDSISGGPLDKGDPHD